MGGNIHTSSTSCHTTTFLQTLEFTLAWILCLALHIVIVVRTAPRADEVRGGEKWRRGGTDLLDRWDRIRKRSGVVEYLLVKAITNTYELVLLSGQRLNSNHA